MLASQTPNRMGRVERATGRGTAEPMQADTRSCGRLRGGGASGGGDASGGCNYRERRLERFDGVGKRRLHAPKRPVCKHVAGTITAPRDQCQQTTNAETNEIAEASNLHECNHEQAR